MWFSSQIPSDQSCIPDSAGTQFRKGSIKKQKPLGACTSAASACSVISFMMVMPFPCSFHMPELPDSSGKAYIRFHPTAWDFDSPYSAAVIPARL